eukprot:m.480739 g.480739  ORF g.480739 m.480739 type:complete len:61 (+) comp53985_c0_seq1:464-646(+)
MQSSDIFSLLFLSKTLQLLFGVCQRQRIQKNSSGAIYYRHGRHVATCAIGEGATRWGPRG